MKKLFCDTVLLITVLSLGGCSSNDKTPTESVSSVVSDIGNQSVSDKNTSESLSDSQTSMPSTEIVSGNNDVSYEKSPITSETYDSSNEDASENPGSDVHIASFNANDYMLDINTVRFIVDESGNVIEPENDNESPLKYVYKMTEYEYIGTGDLLGTRSDAKLYLTEDENILSVFPCEIDAYADAESILSKYSRDRVFEANCFIKIDG